MLAMVLATWGLYALRESLVHSGYEVSSGMFLSAFAVLVGAVYFAFVKLGLREVRRLSEPTDSNSLCE